MRHWCRQDRQNWVLSTSRPGWAASKKSPRDEWSAGRQQTSSRYRYHLTLLTPDTMHFSFLHPFKLNQREMEEPSTVVVHTAAHDTSEGSEILNDALRMEDIILTPTEECVAAGSPNQLL